MLDRTLAGALALALFALPARATNSAIYQTADLRGVQTRVITQPTFRDRHPVAYKTWMAGMYPVRKTFRACCWIGKKSEQTGLTAFLSLCGALGGTAAPFVYGFVKR